MPFFLDRNRTGKDPLLPWKIGALVGGAGLGFAGIYLGIDLLVAVGTGVVFAGVLLRAWGNRRRDEGVYDLSAAEGAVDGAAGAGEEPGTSEEPLS